MTRTEEGPTAACYQFVTRLDLRRDGHLAAATLCVGLLSPGSSLARGPILGTPVAPVTRLSKTTPGIDQPLGIRVFGEILGGSINPELTVFAVPEDRWLIVEFLDVDVRGDPFVAMAQLLVDSGAGRIGYSIDTPPLERESNTRTVSKLVKLYAAPGTEVRAFFEVEPGPPVPGLVSIAISGRLVHAVP